MALRFAFWLLGAGLLGAPAALAACPPAAAIELLAADWLAKRPIAMPPALDGIEDAYCAQAGFVERLGRALGPRVGYKAALTAKQVQARFGVAEPVRGVLLEKMLVADGAHVPAGFGARGVWEADMLLVVADDGINAARTREEALAHLSAMRPFIELADLALAPEAKLDANVLTALNAGARLGVAGAEVPLAPGAETMRRLGETRIVATDGSGAVLAEGKGEAVLGHPLEVVLWLVDSLRREGRRLEAGDLVSVGSFTPLAAPKPGQTVRVQYEGLPGDPTVAVHFE
jgi:2-keto-4-pentenoate hydratase